MLRAVHINLRPMPSWLWNKRLNLQNEVPTHYLKDESFSALNPVCV